MTKRNNIGLLKNKKCYVVLSIGIVFPFIIWFYGSAIVIIRGWGCGFGNRREDLRGKLSIAKSSWK
jgi:hypothetical protein